jgi:adenylate kinase family enzyme
LSRRRIVVVGVSGSGKTTLSGRLGAKLGAPVTELDGNRQTWRFAFFTRDSRSPREVEGWLKRQMPD